LTALRAKRSNSTCANTTPKLDERPKVAALNLDEERIGWARTIVGEIEAILNQSANDLHIAILIPA
jgi:ABC-type branched-subunit amino acid transport system ATPase component